MTRNQTGQVVHLTGPQSAEIKEFDVPSPEPGAVVTEVVRTNICGTEVHMWDGEHPLDNLVPGHEAVCRIVELGDGVETDYAGQPISEGDLVATVTAVPCHDCHHCHVGEFRMCQDAYRYWLRSPEEPPHFHGTFATHYYIQPHQFFYRIPSSLDPGIAAFANCAVTMVLFGVNEVGIEYGDYVVIQGAGGLGLNAIAVAGERGAKTIVIEGVDKRIELARDFCADHVIDFREYNSVESRADRVKELTEGRGADLAIEVAGVPDAFAEGIHLLRDTGEYLVIGNVTPGHTTEFDPGLMTRKSLTVTTLMRADPEALHKSLLFLENNLDQYPFEKLLDDEFALVDIDEALTKASHHDGIRTSVLPGHE